MGSSHTNSTTDLSDAEIVAMCNAGDRSAFGVLMSRHEAALRRRISRFSVSRHSGEDLEQETWVRAFQKLRGLRDGASFRAWLLQVADTTCLGVVRKHKRRDEIAPIVDADPEALSASPHVAADDLSTVTGLLVNLPPQWSEVLMLKYLEQLSLKEIAAHTGLSTSGVKSPLDRAKRAFKEAMEEMSGQQDNDTALEQLMHHAHEATQASRWQEAVETFEAAARKIDLDWNSLQTLGRMYERRGDFPRAIKLLEQALRMNIWPWLRVLVGWCHDGLGEREEAIAAYEEVLASGTAGPWVAAAALAGMKAPYERGKREPQPVGKERAVPRRGWSVKTNHNPDEAHLAIDGDLMTAWASHAMQEPNMYFQVDLGQPWEVTRVVFDDDGGQCIWLANCPHGYVIETSLDGATWQQAAEGSANISEYAGATLDGSPVRYIRARLTQRFQPNWWSIYEIRVYAQR